MKYYVEQQWQAHCLQTYVDYLARPISSIGSPSCGEKRSLGQVIPCFRGSSKKRTSPMGPGSPNIPHHRSQLFTELHELGEKLAVSYTVIGIVLLLCLPATFSIEVRGETLPRYGYVLGAKGHVVEVSLIGQECHSVSQQVFSLRGSAMQLAKRSWDFSWRILKHTRATFVQAVSEDAVVWVMQAFPLLLSLV